MMLAQSNEKRQKIWIFLCLFGILFYIFALRLPVAFHDIHNVDEANVALIADRILDGGTAYQDGTGHRGPVTYYVFALIFRLFGRLNMTAVHLVLIVLHLLIATLIFLIGSRIRNAKTGLWAAFIYALVSYNYRNPSMLAFHTEQCMILFTCLGMYAMLRALDSERPLLFYLSGLSFALAFFSKQPSAADGILAGLFVLGRGAATGNFRRAIRDGALMAAGFFSIVAAVGLFFYSRGAFADFWFYFVTYNTTIYVPSYTWPRILKRSWKYLSRPDSFLDANRILLWGYATGVLMTLGRQLAARKENRPGALEWLPVIWTLVAYAMLSIPGRHWGHYYFHVLPAASLVLGLVLETLARRATPLAFLFPPASRERVISMLMILALLAGYQVFAYTQRERDLYKRTPEYRDMLRYVRTHTGPDDRLFVWGFMPEIYLHSGRKPATRYFVSSFLSGWVGGMKNRDGMPFRDRQVPGGWEIFRREMDASRAAVIVDVSPGGYRGYEHFQPRNYPELREYIMEHYGKPEVILKENGRPAFRIFLRDDQAASSEPASGGSSR